MVEKIRKKGWVGIELDHGEANGNYPTVTNVIGGSPAQAAGLRPGDVLLAVDGLDHGIGDPKAVKSAYKGFRPGTRG